MKAVEVCRGKKGIKEEILFVNPVDTKTDGSFLHHAKVFFAINKGHYDFLQADFYEIDGLGFYEQCLVVSDLRFLLNTNCDKIDEYIKEFAGLKQVAKYTYKEEIKNGRKTDSKTKGGR